MKIIQRNALTMLQDALATATHNPPPTPPPDFPAIVADLTATIARIQGAAVTQGADRSSSSLALRAARTRLIDDHLIPIREIAVGRLAAVPNVRQLFRVPPRTVHRARLIQDATVIANTAAEYTSVFVASGLPPDFVEQLRAAIARVSSAGDSRVATRGDQQQATQTLKTLLTQGKQLVRGLNGIMRVAFAQNAEALAVWNSARRLRRTTTPPGDATAAPAPPSATSAEPGPVRPSGLRAAS